MVSYQTVGGKGTVLNDIASKSRTGFLVVRKPSSKLIAISLLCRELFPLVRKEKTSFNPTSSHSYAHIACFLKRSSSRTLWPTMSQLWLCSSPVGRRHSCNRNLDKPVPVLEPWEPDCILLLEYLQSVSLFVHFLLSTFELGNTGGKASRLSGMHDDACWQSEDKSSMPGSASYLLGHCE